jgi:hypothetical protein
MHKNNKIDSGSFALSKKVDDWQKKKFVGHLMGLKKAQKNLAEFLKMTLESE